MRKITIIIICAAMCSIPAIVSESPKQHIAHPEEQPKVQEEKIQPDMHPHQDTAYAKLYKKDVSSRDARYGVASKPAQFSIATHKAGKRMDIDAFTSTVRAVYQRMPHVRTTQASVKLIVETAITESDMGRVLVLGDNYGALQIQEATAKHVISYLKSEHEDIHAAVENLRDKKQSLRWNLTHNIPYQIAMSITCYWHKLPNYAEHIASREDRATLWKSVYNTRLGKGTVEKYEKRVALAMK